MSQIYDIIINNDLCWTILKFWEKCPRIYYKPWRYEEQCPRVLCNTLSSTVKVNHQPWKGDSIHGHKSPMTPFFNLHHYVIVRAGPKIDISCMKNEIRTLFHISTLLGIFFLFFWDNNRQNWCGQLLYPLHKLQ